MNLRIKSTIVKKTNIDYDDIRTRTLLALGDRGYKIIKDKGFALYFDRYKDQVLLTSRMEAFSKIDEGKIELNILGADQSLKLVYSVSILTEVIIISILIFVGAVYDHFMFIFSILVALQLLTRVIIIRSSAKNIIASILSIES